MMALELFKPFIIRKLNQRDDKVTIKHAKKMVERESPEIWDILEDLTKDYFVLLNRAPTPSQARYPGIPAGAG